jgi:spore germination protein
MRNKKMLLIMVTVFLLSSMGCSGVARKPLLGMKRLGVSGFYVNEPGGNDSYRSLTLHADVLNEIYPLWYHVRTDGSLKAEVNQQAINFAKSKGVKILPLINVVPNQDAVLVDPAAMSRAVANIVQVVKANNYDGANIDFEFIPDSHHKDFAVDRNKMTMFMKNLHNQLQSIGKMTHMCVLPHVGVPTTMSGVYDYGALSPYVDKVTIMTYDHSQADSPPGPLAPFNWVEKNITEAIKQGFKPQKICLGVATYGYDWPAGKAGGFSTPTKVITQNAAIKGIQIKWNDQSQEPYYVYTGQDGVSREVWFENEVTLQTKLDLVKNYNLAGVCIWRLGFENEKFWQRIIKVWGKR